jgi:hypothetical protein
VRSAGATRGNRSHGVVFLVRDELYKPERTFS